MTPTALRDVLGLARCLYAAEADPERRAKIKAAGEQLATAERYASMEPGSLGHRRAPTLAVEALAALHLVGWSADVERIVETAVRRT